MACPTRRISEGNPVYPHQGMVDFTDNRVDLNTGTLRFRAKLANPNQMISPGLFVKVRLPIGEAHPALMIREQALQSDQGLKKVFVLRSQDEKGNPYSLKDAKGEPVPAYKPVAVDVGTPGVLRNGFREISQGIKPGDKVVAVGMQKIRLGKNPVTKEDYLVLARPFDPERDSWTRPVARPAADSTGGSPVATAGATGKSLIGDPAAEPAVPAAGSPAGTPKQSSQRPGPAPAHSLTRADNDSGSSGRRGR